jgi:hypothetical protein
MGLRVSSRSAWTAQCDLEIESKRSMGDGLVMESLFSVYKALASTPRLQEKNRQNHHHPTPLDVFEVSSSIHSDTHSTLTISVSSLSTLQMPCYLLPHRFPHKSKVFSSCSHEELRAVLMDPALYHSQVLPSPHEVREEPSIFPGTSFAYAARQLGTGRAEGKWGV